MKINTASRAYSLFTPVSFCGAIVTIASLLLQIQDASAVDALSCKKSKPPGAGTEGVPAAVEAKTGFSDFDSNGVVTKDEFAALRTSFADPEKIEDGLGPFYNGTSCSACHHNPVTGGSSQVAVMRAGHLEFIDPSKPGGGLVFKDHPGGSLVHQRSTGGAVLRDKEPKEFVPNFQKHITSGDAEHTLRMSTNLLGLGYVECIGDADLVGQQQSQFHTPFGDLHGTIMIVISSKDLGSAVQRVGRFGWKCQLASLLDFSADAYINEMGITNPLHPMENPAENGDDVTPFDGKFDKDGKHVEPNDPQEEKGEKHLFGVDTETFAKFMRATMAPPKDEARAATEDAKKGKALFEDNEKTGCAICHVPSWTTLSAGTPLPGMLNSAGAVPDKLGSKIIYPYSDFLIHDIGTGDGIVQQQHAQFPPTSGKDVEPLSLDGNGISYGSEKWLGIVRTREVVESGKKTMLKSNVLPSRAGGPSQVLTGDLLETANKIRTAPLWALRTRVQLLHDGSALTIHDAIMKHRGQAEVVRRNYETVLSDDERKQLLAFLSSL